MNWAGDRARRGGGGGGVRDLGLSPPEWPHVRAVRLRWLQGAEVSGPLPGGPGLVWIRSRSGAGLCLDLPAFCPRLQSAGAA